MAYSSTTCLAGHRPILRSRSDSGAETAGGALARVGNPRPCTRKQRHGYALVRHIRQNLRIFAARGTLWLNKLM